MNIYLKKLKEAPNKILITPQGMLRSKSFEVVSEVTNLAEPPYFKKFLTNLSKATEPSPKTND